MLGLAPRTLSFLPPDFVWACDLIIFGLISHLNIQIFFGLKNLTYLKSSLLIVFVFVGKNLF